MPSNTPKWIIENGVKYAKSDYVLIGWQETDLPTFGRIQTILVINNVPLFVVTVYHASGIICHYHSFVIEQTSITITISLAKL